jgi:hypothetical protein
MTIVVLAAGSAAQAGADIFSCNFYAPGRVNQGAGTEWNQEAWMKTITLEPDQAAGVGDWETTGWVNIATPKGRDSICPLSARFYRNCVYSSTLHLIRI